MKVVYLGLIRSTINKPEEEVELPPGSRVRDLLRLLMARYGDAFKATVMREDGSLRPLAKVLLDDCDVEELQGLDTELGGKAEACIMVVVELPAGG